jgi:hypothetical protein
MSVLKVEYKGKSYELGFTRNSVVAMERQGFNVNEIGNKPMTMLPMFWQGAFVAYNKGVKRALMDEIYDNISDKTGLISALTELYAETLNTLTDEPAEDKGNATWEIVR